MPPECPLCGAGMTRNNTDDCHYIADYGCDCTAAEHAAYQRGKEHERMNRDAQWERAMRELAHNVDKPLVDEYVTACRERVQREEQS